MRNSISAFKNYQDDGIQPSSKRLVKICSKKKKIYPKAKNGYRLRKAKLNLNAIAYVRPKILTT